MRTGGMGAGGGKSRRERAVRKRVEGESDFAVLGRWVRLAARVDSVSEFEKGM